jgi:hypothetical protein
MDCFILHRQTDSIFTFQKEVLFYQYDRKQDERGNHKKECWEYLTMNVKKKFLYNSQLFNNLGGGGLKLIGQRA